MLQTNHITSVRRTLYPSRPEQLRTFKGPNWSTRFPADHGRLKDWGGNSVFFHGGGVGSSGEISFYQLW